MNEFMTALASFKNDTTVGLMNINLDVALFKCQPPVEYTQVGQTISKRRKKSAEEGSLHMTARKLAELFSNILPKTRNVLQAYGKRVSEVTSDSSVNPRGSQLKDGIFSSYTGIDSAGIWAAATSEGARHFCISWLACLLSHLYHGGSNIDLGRVSGATLEPARIIHTR